VNDFEKLVEEQGAKYGRDWMDKLRLADEAIKFGWTSAKSLIGDDHLIPTTIYQLHAHKFAELVIAQLEMEHQNHAKKMVTLGMQTFAKKMLATLLKGVNVATTVMMQALMPEEARSASSVRNRPAPAGGPGDGECQGGTTEDPGGHSPGHSDNEPGPDPSGG